MRNIKGFLLLVGVCFVFFSCIGFLSFSGLLGELSEGAGQNEVILRATVILIIGIGLIYFGRQELGSIGPPNVDKLKAQRNINGLIAALRYNDEKGHVRQAAAGALGQIGDTQAVEPLITALKDHLLNVRAVAAEALVQIGTPAVMPLIATFGDKNENVRQAAAGALVQIGTPAIEPLIATLNSLSEDVRETAARVLGQIGDARALEPLIVALKKGYVSMAAIDALKQANPQLKIEIEAVIAEAAKVEMGKLVERLVALYDGSPHGEGFLVYSSEVQPVRAIGQTLDTLGGFKLMLEAHALFAQYRPRAARNLEMVWDGIGNWQG